MEDNLVNEIVELHKEKKWREIVEKYHDHPDRNKILWVFPSEDNFEFLRRTLKELQCNELLSIGCGSGLLEWMIKEATGGCNIISLFGRKLNLTMFETSFKFFLVRQPCMFKC